MIKLCQWDITGSCNLNCIYCREKSTSKLGHLTTAEMFGIVDQFAETKIKSVTISGGEPLTLKTLPQIFKYLRDRVDIISLTTNATLISPNNVKYIKNYCDNVQVSIDGYCADIHDSLRGTGSFDKTIRGIKLLLNNDINVSTRLTICDQNIKSVAKYIEFVHGLGIKSVHLRRVIPAGNFSGKNLISCGSLYEAYKSAFTTGKKLGTKVGSIDYFSIIEFDEEKRNLIEKEITRRPKQLIGGCSIGIDTIYIAQDGKVLFCPYLPIYCGDAIKEHLSEIWEKAEMFKINRSLRWNLKGKCSVCRFKMACGGCPAHAFLTTGDITESDGGCWINETVQ